MSKVDTGKIRNLAVTGHGKAGKTTLVEALLFATGSIDRMGRVEDGNTTTDYEPEEVSRQTSITSSLAFCDYKGHRVNLLDTPGFVNFLEDTRGSMRATDGLVLMLSAISGIKGETEKIWGYANDFNIPRLVFVNKIDKEGADFYAAVEGLEKNFKARPLCLQIPLGTSESFKGLVDLRAMKAVVYTNGKGAVEEIPSDMKERAAEYRKKLVETVAEADDAMLEKYLEGTEPTEEELTRALRLGVAQNKFTPVTCGAPNKALGITELLEAITLCLPSPAEAALQNPIRGTNPSDATQVTRKPEPTEPLSAFVFKTVADPFAGKLSLFRVYSGTLNADSSIYNSSCETVERVGQIFHMQGKKQVPAKSLGPGEMGVVAKLKYTGTGDTLTEEAKPIVFERVHFAEPLISYAIAPKSKGDEDKVSTGLHKILDEDPTLHFHRDEEAKEMILSGMGQSHLELTLEKLKRKFGVEVEMKAPKIPYRETIRATAKAQGRYKKQSGGKGQFGDCWIEISPRPRGAGYEFVDDIVGGSIPRQYIPAVDKGIQEAMREGLYAGYPMVDVSVSLYDGSYHAVDSSEMAFKIAGSLGIKKALESARPVVLEPVMKVDITMPEEYLGTVIGDLNARRGKVSGMDQLPGNTTQKVSALVPMAEMLTYANQLHSMTAGRGIYHMEFDHYDELPTHLTQKLLDERAREKKE